MYISDKVRYFTNTRAAMICPGRTIPAQRKKLLDLLSKDGVLVNGQVSYSCWSKKTFWKRIALHLNSVDGGAYKTAWQWCKMFADWKAKTKKKADELRQKKHYSDGEKPPELNSLELRMLKLVEYPMDDKADVFKVSKVEMPETAEDEMPDFPTESHDDQPNQDPMTVVEAVVETMVSEDEDNAKFSRSKRELSDYDFLPESHDDQPNQDPMTVVETVVETMVSEDEDNAKFSRSKREPSDDDFIDDEGDSISETSEESSEPERKVKTEGKKFFDSGKRLKKDTTLEQFKIRTTLQLEKERVKQKSEELRLRALELKLKGEELRLKEIEINKINYLTNVEDEKLKCFRDISSSLKE